MIDQDNMRALVAELRKGSGGRFKWYAMGRDETSYFMDFDWGYNADRWFSDQQKSRAAWIEQEGIHIVKKLFQTELETNAAAAADAIDLLLAEVEAASSPGMRLASARRKIDKLRAELEAAAAEKRQTSDPVAKITGADEYGPMLQWSTHWAELIGADLYASQPVRQELSATVTEAEISAAARVLSDSNADLCYVDRDDNWKIHGDEFRVEARAVLEAALAQRQGEGS